MSTIAANSVTSGQQAAAVSGGAASSTPVADLFAAILDQAVQDAAGTATADPSAVTATSAASANDNTTDPSAAACAAASPSASDNTTPVSNDPSTDPNAVIPADPSAPAAAAPSNPDAPAPAGQPDGSLALSILQDDDSQIPAQAGATPAQVPVQSLTPAADDDATDAASPNDANAVQGSTTSAPAAKPQRVAEHRQPNVRSTPKPATDPSPDPSVVQTPVQPAPAATPLVADPSAAAQPATALVSDIDAAPLQAAPAASDPASAPNLAAAAAAADDQTDTPPSDVAASAMAPAGTIVKPAKPGEATKPQAGNTKTQAPQSAAATTLADAGKAIGRTFTDQKVSSALPVHGAADPSKPAAPQTADPSTSPDAGKATAAPAPDTATASTTATSAPQPQLPAVAPSAHAQAAPAQQSASLAVTAAPGASVQAAPPPAANAAVSAQLQIGHPAQPDIGALAFNIAAKSEGGSKQFDIRLDPAELGRVDVRLTVDDAGKTQAMLSVEKPQTLELLQKDQPQLERALKDAGLDLTQNGLNFSLKGQQQNSNSGGNALPSRGRTLAARAIAAVDSAASTVSLGSVSASDTRLDIRV